MKINYKKPVLGVALAAVLALGGCSKQLEEKPYTVFTPEYFKTITGYQSGVNSLYSGLRWIYGPEGAVAVTQAGTDEFTAADQTRTGAAGDLLTICNYTITPGNGAILTPWNRSFNNINLANALVEFAPLVPIEEAQKKVFLAEASFLRGLYYLGLVSQFGPVPVDLGSGELKFNQSPFQGFNRPLENTDLLKKNYDVMLADFQFAAENLPDKRPANAFRLSKAAAFLMLARTYTYRAYSEVKQGGDFAKAYNASMEVINNQARYGVGLLADYGDVHKEGDDYNQEILFSVERLPGDINSNEAISGAIGGGKGVDAANDFTPEYTFVKAPLVTSANAPAGARTAQYGRPIRRFCPTPWLYNVAFADKVNDSRYDNTFRTVWLATQAVGGFNLGDTAFVLAKTNADADSIAALRKPYRVVAPREFYLIGGSFGQNIFPSLRKYEDSKKAIPNDPGGRPFVVGKLSELYLLAAEAAIQGAGNGAAEAASLINVLRNRAAFRPGLSASLLAERRARIAVSAAQMNLDFILDERTRELCGESLRWPDLARRGKLVERVKAFNPDGAPNIKDFHVFRPIPRSQLENTAVPNTQQYQNPGY